MTAEKTNVQLVIIKEKGDEVKIPFLRSEITIGRKEGNTIKFEDRNISRRHARLKRIGENIFVEDLDSYNGVKLNGKKISRKENVYIGDIIEIGEFQIRFDPLPQDALKPLDLESLPPYEKREEEEEPAKEIKKPIFLAPTRDAQRSVRDTSPALGETSKIKLPDGDTLVKLTSDMAAKENTNSRRARIPTAPIQDSDINQSITVENISVDISDVPPNRRQTDVIEDSIREQSRAQTHKKTGLKLVEKAQKTEDEDMLVVEEPEEDIHEQATIESAPKDRQITQEVIKNIDISIDDELDKTVKVKNPIEKTVKVANPLASDALKETAKKEAEQFKPAEPKAAAPIPASAPAAAATPMPSPKAAPTPAPKTEEPPKTLPEKTAAKEALPLPTRNGSARISKPEPAKPAYEPEPKRGSGKAVYVAVVIAAIAIAAFVGYMTFGKTKTGGQTEQQQAQQQTTKTEAKTEASKDKAGDANIPLINPEPSDKTEKKTGIVGANMSQDEINRYISQTKKFIELKKWPAAIETITNLLRVMPDHSDGKALEEKAKMENASEAAFFNANRFFSEKKLDMARGKLLEITEDSVYFSQAKTLLKSVEKQIIDESSYRGKSYASEGNYDAAVKEAEKIIMIDPQNTAAKKILNDAKGKSKAVKEAQEAQEEKESADGTAVKEQKQAKPEGSVESAMMMKKATELFYEKRYQEAADVFKKVIAIDPTNALAYRSLGSCYAAIGKADMAVKAYERYIKLAPAAKDVNQVREIIDHYKQK